MPFKEIVGHRRQGVLVSRSIGRRSLPPSVIFAGPDGVGKRLTAVATAQALNCTNPILVDTTSESDGFDIDACGTCAACTRIARRVHADVFIIEPGETGSIKIEQVRDLVDRAAFRPFEGRRRVVIIDEAETLVTQAQNALLKTLEEPPASSVFILVTAQPDLLLPTVRSRCPTLRFGPLGLTDIAAVLVKRGHSEAQARAVAATADGSLRRALDASAGESVDGRDIAERVLSRVAGSDDPRRKIEGAKDLLSKTGGGGAADREYVALHLRAMASLLRDVELLSTRADVRALANPDVRPALDRLADVYRGERGVRAFAAVDRALVALDKNAGAKLVADWLALQL